ncbi:MAG: peroxide stress protein YaaA [Crocinitomix sp.]|nr:peroxide stress protein YaaA [Crocinitomix sp.]
MKIILSPAKSLNEEVIYGDISLTSIPFKEDTFRLAKKLKKLSARQISKLMGVSNDIAALNYDRFQNFSEAFNTENSIPAGFIFSGAAYQGLRFAELSKAEQEEGQNRLRILSGLYGLLKPFDLIQPYRLEMGTSFKVTPKVTNLYKFWGDKIHNQLAAELKEEGSNLLVNVASAEYFKAAKLNNLKDIEIITPVFKDINKDGEFKVNMTFAKMSRGRMTRFIIQNKIEKAEHLKAFDGEGYEFSPNDSSDAEFVYLRSKRP